MLNSANSLSKLVFSSGERKQYIKELSELANSEATDTQIELSEVSPC